MLWKGCQSVAGLTHKDKEPFMLTFRSTVNSPVKPTAGLWMEEFTTVKALILQKGLKHMYLFVGIFLSSDYVRWYNKDIRNNKTI